MSEVTFVGTSDAFGAGGRRQSAVFVRGPGGAVLLDCGATTLSGLAACGIARDEIDAILVSHFHGDHFAGIPPLLLASHYEDRRTRPLLVAGPPGVERRVRALGEALGHSLADGEWTFPITFRELPAGREVECGPFRANAFETRHQPEVNPHGMVVDTGSCQIAYSGDTGWFDQLPSRVRGSALFICECTFKDSSLPFHLNLGELEARRDAFDCGRIVLTHLGSQMTALRGNCSFETADDGMQLRI